MDIVRFRRKSEFLAVLWTGSNLSEIQDFVDLLPSLDPRYSSFTSVSVSSGPGSNVTITWNPSGSLQVATGDWVVEGITDVGFGLVTSMDDAAHTGLYKVLT